MKLSALSLLLGLLLVALASWHNAGGVDLLTNGGFEDGVVGWTQSEGALSTVDDPVHSGATAARFAGDGQPSNQFIFQWVAVTPGNDYQLSGWVVRNDPNIDHIFFRIDWFDDTVSLVSSVDSTADPVDKPEFQLLTTVPVNAPANAHLARVSLRIIASAEFEVFADDILFDGPEPTPTPSPILTPSPTPEPAPTPTATPTQTPTATSTPTPTPSPSPSPTPSPTATPTATPTPTAIPTPAATPSPSPTQTPSPTASPTTAPTANLTATPTTKPMASPTPTATQPISPTQTATPAVEPDVFPTLVNGGFEQRRADGTPYGWHKFGGGYSLVDDPVADGTSSLKMTSDTASTKWVYQAVSIEGGKHYQLTASSLKNDPAVDGVFLRISFYETDDASGAAIESADSTTVLDNDDPAFRSITTGPVRAPDDARAARLRMMLRPVSQLPATAYLDSVTFAITAAPSLTPTPTGTVVATATATAPVATLGPTATPSSTPTDDEPSVFTQLTNGSFEETRSDGTPFGWRKVGGEIAVTGEHAAHGGSALAFHSSTGSTKWTYQNIRVEPLAFYEASTFAMPPASGEAFLRLSWYETDDGSGPAITSADSIGSATGSSFELVRTGSVQAPADARSVKLKLMLRPGTEAPTAAYFDAVAFARTSAPAGNQASGGQSSTSSGSQVNPVDASPSAEAGLATDPPPAALGAVSTPRVIANVTLAPAAPPAASTLSTNDGPNYDWAIALSIIIPLIGFAFLGAYELQRPKREPDE